MTCTNVNPVSRNYLVISSWELRLRTGYSGLYGDHPNVTTFEFNSGFHSRMGSWASGLNSLFSNYGSLPNMTLDWAGCIGVTGCPNDYPYHPAGKGFDLTKVAFESGNKLDMNVHWRAGESLQERRWYLAVVAHTRRYFGQVLAAYLEPDTFHDNHIHITDSNSADDGVGIPFGPINTGLESDTNLVRRACRLINGSSVADDGPWDSALTTAYNSLRSAMNMSCVNPQTSATAASDFLLLIARTAAKNKTAGFYTYGGC